MPVTIGVLRGMTPGKRRVALVRGVASRFRDRQPGCSSKRGPGAALRASEIADAAGPFLRCAAPRSPVPTH